LYFSSPALVNKKKHPNLNPDNSFQDLLEVNMNIVQRSPFFELDKFFDTFSQPSRAREATNDASFSPRVDIYDNGDSYQLIAELPGISKDNIAITVDDSTLTIEAHHPSTDEQSDKQPAIKALRRERQLGKYTRSFNLGQDIEQSDIKASFNDGLLTLTIAKLKEDIVQARNIEIH
jgi:HSP20 family protein